MDVCPEPPAGEPAPAAALADWPQPLANPAHAPGNVAAPLGFTRPGSADIGTPAATASR